VRPSSGAETEGEPVAFGQSDPPERAEVAVAEEGRTPLNASAFAKPATADMPRSINSAVNEKMPAQLTNFPEIGVSFPLAPSFSPSETIVSDIFLAVRRSREMPFKASLMNRVACSAEQADATFR